MFFLHLITCDLLPTIKSLYGVLSIIAITMHLCLIYNIVLSLGKTVFHSLFRVLAVVVHLPVFVVVHDAPLAKTRQQHESFTLSSFSWEQLFLLSC